LSNPEDRIMHSIRTYLYLAICGSWW